MIRNFIILLCITGLAACVPTAARKNAKLKPGLDLDVSVGTQYVKPGVDNKGETTKEVTVRHLEVDGQWATKLNSGGAVALQLKVPINLFFTTADVFYQLPNNGNWYFGVGGEIGIMPAGYGVLTRYLQDDLYISFTQRIITLKSKREGFKEVIINPQLSLGIDGHGEFSGFISYAKHTGQGFNFRPDLFQSGASDYRTRFTLVGISARF
jgi:hypothetical protein